jgi:AcrR family transcriptional regulator
MAGATRRAQRREETVAEIRKLAVDQVVAGGPDAVSLNAIAGEMGMSPAAIYRYFTNRDALLADLVVSFYDALADALEAVPDRLPEVARAYREWALANPNGYRLIFQTTSGSGIDLAPERTIPAATRSMVVILGALAGGPARRTAVGGTAVGEPLVGQLREWAARTELPDVPEWVLALGLVCWTRLHGVLSLELGHHLGSTGVDPALLYEAEIDGLVATLAAP